MRCFAPVLVPLTLWMLAPAALAADQSPGSGDPPQGYLLRYDLQAQERLDYEVTHVAKTKTRIRGAEEISQVHTVSRRHWEVSEVTEEGRMTFNHVIDSVEMTQSQGDGKEIRWDSKSGNEPPPVFEMVSDQIGKVLATVTVNPQGQELDREDHGGTKASLGMGSLTLALPKEPIQVGESWSVPREVKARTESGEIKTIKIRERYTLEEVQTGVAKLSLRSEPLTPIHEASVRAQVVQQLSNGTIRFDVDNGRMLSKQLDWDETVIGFQGPNSLMEYRARMTEQLIPGAPRTAQRP